MLGTKSRGHMIIISEWKEEEEGAVPSYERLYLMKHHLFYTLDYIKVLKLGVRSRLC